MSVTLSRTSRWQFFRTFLRDRRIASVVPTSPLAVQRICRRLDFSRPLTIVELGPGNGAFTRYLLARLLPGSRIVAVEQNQVFTDALKSIRDPCLTVVHGQAGDLTSILAQRGLSGVAVALSGIPFSFFSAERQRAIMRQVAAALAPDGLFLVYQFSPQVGKHLAAVFPRVEHFRAWWNLPPLHCYAVSLS